MIKDTVFSPSFGNRPQQLIGREMVMEQFLSGLDGPPGSRERATMILGERGSGKTVLLLEMAEQARQRGYIVASPTIVSGNMLERIVEKIQDEGESMLHDNRQKLSGASIGVLGFSAGLQFTKDVQETKSFAYKLSKLADALGRKKKGILILIDEVQANNTGLKELIIAYQELIGEGRNIAIAFAGLPGAISATLNEHVLTFLNRANRIRLEPLRISDIDAYYRNAFRSLNLQISEEQRETAAKATEGSPYLMQLIGHNIALYADDGGCLDDQDLKQALDKAKDRYENDICGATVNALSDKDLEFLKAMADLPEQAKIADIRKILQVTADYAQSYKRRLIDAGVITQVRRGEVRFAIPMLADYLKKEK